MIADVKGILVTKTMVIMEIVRMQLNGKKIN